MRKGREPQCPSCDLVLLAIFRIELELSAMGVFRSRASMLTGLLLMSPKFFGACASIRSLIFQKCLWEPIPLLLAKETRHLSLFQYSPRACFGTQEFIFPQKAASSAPRS